MTQEQLTKFLTMSENIQEQIQILVNFGISVILRLMYCCGIVSDEFEANGCIWEH